MIGNTIVSIIKKNTYEYPDSTYDFRPSERYPEYPFEDISFEKNEVYDSVRLALSKLGLDRESFGTSEWNPLKDFVKEGDYVLLKPNMVMDYNQNPTGGTECLYTQPSVVAAMIDYVIIALGKTGKIVLGDAPMQECNFEKLVSDSGYDKLVKYYRDKGYNIEIVDFRGLKSKVEKRVHKAIVDENVQSIIVDLGKASEFAGQNRKLAKRMRITNYDPRILNSHHDDIKNEYCISKHILDADVIINMPKPKTHRKAGVTISLKNFVGANARKEFLPHHTSGSKAEGGDEYLKYDFLHKISSKLYDKKNIYEAEEKYGMAKVCIYAAGVINRICSHLRKDYSEGSWYGNNTISRTVTDLNKLVYYADKTGNMCDVPQRKVIIIADMIVSGEKEGPVCPTPRNVGVIAAGTNPVIFDDVITTYMGFDSKKIPTICCARGIKSIYKLVDENVKPVIVSNDDLLENDLSDKRLLVEDYEPTNGWKGYIERSRNEFNSEKMH